MAFSLAGFGIQASLKKWESGFPSCTRTRNGGTGYRETERPFGRFLSHPLSWKKYVDKNMESGSRFGWNRIVFGHSEGWNGKLYRFKGVFALDRAATNYEHGSVWRRVS